MLLDDAGQLMIASMECIARSPDFAQHVRKDKNTNRLHMDILFMVNLMCPGRVVGRGCFKTSHGLSLSGRHCYQLQTAGILCQGRCNPWNPRNGSVWIPKFSHAPKLMGLDTASAKIRSHSLMAWQQEFQSNVFVTGLQF